MCFEHKDKTAAKSDTVGESGVDLPVQNEFEGVNTDSYRPDRVSLNFYLHHGELSKKVAGTNFGADRFGTQPKMYRMWACLYALGLRLEGWLRGLRGFQLPVYAKTLRIFRMPK